jgi:hypothetical protein
MVHGRAMRTHKLVSSPEEFEQCDCCEQAVLPELQLGTPLKSLSYLGVCFPLYF